jgi:hypothetical protein
MQTMSSAQFCGNDIRQEEMKKGVLGKSLCYEQTTLASIVSVTSPRSL